jgi:cysteine desulfurase family protein (TIGR01976 family)
MNAFPVDQIRKMFPALSRTQDGNLVCHFDGPAGSQVPRRVADAVSDYLLTTNANRGAPFPVSQHSDMRLDVAHLTLADFLGTRDPGCIAFGQNMTSLTFALSRALAKSWKPGDEIVVTDLDHDANVTPWVLAAEDAGATIRRIPVRLEDCTLDRDVFRDLLSDATKLVAIGYASNATGTINPVKELIAEAKSVGAMTFIDAVHMAPHGLIDVTDLDCDFLCCSAYKFFGPHIGVMYGKRERLESIRPYKLRPSPETLPGRWMTGTQSHEAMIGAAEAVEYLADLGNQIATTGSSRREGLMAACMAIGEHERTLSGHLLQRLREFPQMRLWGIDELDRLTERVPTFSFTYPGMNPMDISKQLAKKGIYSWPGNHYAIPFTEAAGLEPEGTLRIGLLHYNSLQEVDRLCDSLTEILPNG